MKFYKRWLVLSIFILDLIGAVPSYGARRVAIVVYTHGNAWVANADEQYPITRQSFIYGGDKIVTAANAMVLLRYDDGTLHCVQGANGSIIKNKSGDEATINSRTRWFKKLLKTSMRMVAGLDPTYLRQSKEFPVTVFGIR